MLALNSKKNKFFVLFSESARLAQKGAYILHDALIRPESLPEKVKQVFDLEHEADELNDEILDNLHQTFITPLDREDIFALTNQLDDIVDYVEDIVERMALFRVSKPTGGAIELGKLLALCTDELVSAFDLLANIKGNREKILDLTKNIVEMEEKGDHIYREEVARLFIGNVDPIDIIKWKEILELQEDALDHCERIADQLKGVLMKYA